MSVNNSTTLPLSNISYTNKDFSTIFPELLDTVSALTKKWSPIDYDTNESDPGIVLLKLVALIGDKLNYNIDKNVLECFPLSVTQEGNARQMFSQLGYNMRWYRSATTDVYVKYIGDSSDTEVTIPAFTMVSDENNSTTFTLLGDSTLSDSNDSFVVEDKVIKLDGTTYSFKAIQGVAYTYGINDETTIMPYHLDSNNRIYFNTRNVAENGIFITNVSTDGSVDYSSWERKDNLLVQQLGNKYYSFGVSSDGASCYIEFPEDAESLIGNGIQIVYISSNGTDGNISNNVIEKFYADLTIGDVTFTMDNTTVYNPYSCDNGKNPETIDEALVSFRKIVGTFDTLVTLRDYENYINKNGETTGTSNGFACDRTNDVQNVYNVVTSSNGATTVVPVIGPDIYVSSSQTDHTEMSAYELKLYFLSRPSTFDTQTKFNNSFSMLRYSGAYNDMDLVHSVIEDSKSISHDYSEIEPTSSQAARICFIKNKYPIKARIYTKQVYTDVVYDDIRKNVQSYLWQKLNSTNVDFSEKITSDTLSELITSADSRISKTQIDSFNYTTYAVYWDGTSYKEAQLNGDSVENELLSSEITYAYGVTDPVTSKSVSKYKTTGVAYSAGDYVLFPLIDSSDVSDPSYISRYSDRYDRQHRWKCIKAVTAPAGDFTIALSKKCWELCDTEASLIDLDTLQKLQRTDHGYDYGTYGTFTAEKSHTSTYEWKVSNTYENGYQTFTESELASKYGVVITNAMEGDSIVFGASKSAQCRDEILTKSVLAGVTPMFESSEEFDYTYNQSIHADTYTDGTYRDIKSIKSFDTFSVQANVQKELRDGESIQFMSPSLLSVATYSNYVNICYNLTSSISKNVSRRLNNGEWVSLFWKDSEDDTLYNYAIYYGSAEETSCSKYWICPTFDMTVGGADAPTTIATFVTSIPYTTSTVDYCATRDKCGAMTSTVASAITSLYNSKYILSGTKSVAVKVKNQISIDGTFHMYWVLSSDTNGKYILFSKDTTAQQGDTQEYILGTNEYFFYTKGSSSVGILGAGSKIQRTLKSTSGGFTTDWVVNADVTLSGIAADGYDALQTLWFTIDSSKESATLIENQYATLGPKSIIKMSANHTFTSSLSSIASGVTVLYKSSSADSEFSDLSDLIDGASSLEARALLSMNLSAGEEQTLYSGQSIAVYYPTSDPLVSSTYDTISGADGVVQSDGSTKYNTTIQFSRDIALDGTSEYKMYEEDSSGEFEYSSMYYYAHHEDVPSVTYNSSGDAIITVSGVTSGTQVSKSVSFKVPSTCDYDVFNTSTSYSVGDKCFYNNKAYICTSSHSAGSWDSSHFEEIYSDNRYLIKMQCSSTNLTAFSFKLNGVTCSPIDGRDELSSINSGVPVYYDIQVGPCYIDGTYTRDTVTVTFTSGVSEGTVSVTLTNMFRHTRPSGRTSEEEKKLEMMVSKFDINNSFDYSYQPSSVSMIDDPLSADSFFESNHVLSKFVIAQAEAIPYSCMTLIGGDK